VETVEHGTVLLRLGCQLAQGFGIARPMAAEKMPTWAATWKPDAAWCALTGTGSALQSTDKQNAHISGPIDPELGKELQQLHFL
jgi:predicted signal transduction protein with EAL and GGDEF domain